MSSWNGFVPFGDTECEKEIRVKAHAFTLGSICFLPFSSIGYLALLPPNHLNIFPLRFGSYEFLDWISLLAITGHLLLVITTILFWIFEKPRKAVLKNYNSDPRKLY